MRLIEERQPSYTAPVAVDDVVVGAADHRVVGLLAFGAIGCGSKIGAADQDVVGSTALERITIGAAVARGLGAVEAAGRILRTRRRSIFQKAHAFAAHSPRRRA